MVPWPIALLSVLYAGVASSTAVTVWHRWQGHMEGSWVLPVSWCVVSGALVVGLALLKPWARSLAVWTSAIILAGALGMAVKSLGLERPAPMGSLFATGWASIQLLVIRYLTRPHVKAWFAASHKRASRLGHE